MFDRRGLSWDLGGVWRRGWPQALRTPQFLHCFRGIGRLPGRSHIAAISTRLLTITFSLVQSPLCRTICSSGTRHEDRSKAWPSTGCRRTRFYPGDRLARLGRKQEQQARGLASRRLSDARARLSTDNTLVVVGRLRDQGRNRARAHANPRGWLRWRGDPGGGADLTCISPRRRANAAISLTRIPRQSCLCSRKGKRTWAHRRSCGPERLAVGRSAYQAGAGSAPPGKRSVAMAERHAYAPRNKR